MPNWVVNVLQVFGNNGETSREDVVAFLKQHLHTRTYDEDVSTIFDFNTVIPAPDREYEYVPLKDRLGHGTTPQPDIHWRIKNWGVKWNSRGNQHFDYEAILNGPAGIGGLINIVFETAWHPPLPIAKKLILMHPELNIHWHYYSFESCECGAIGREAFDENELYHEGAKFGWNKREL